VQAFRRRRRTERRGVLLLLMLSLLVLFAVVGVTYVLLSSQFRRSAGGPARLEQYAVDSAKQLDEAVMQVFRGSNSPLSVLSIHSLLEDMNGNDAVASMPTSFTTGSASTLGTPNTISSAAISLSNQNTPLPNPNTQVQLVDLTLLSPLPWPLATNAAAKTAAVSSQVSTGVTSPYKGYTDPNGSAPSGFYNGCLLTFTTGPAAGQSTRIVGYDNGITTNSTSSKTILRVMGFPGATALINAGTGPNGWQFLINGRPFNGTGFGFNFSTNLVDAVDNTPSAPPQGPRLFALLPNPVFFSNTYAPGNAASAYNVAGGVGGADEDYDAADWNNMLLGLPLDPRDVTGSLPTIPLAPNYPPYPSLHRPELVQFWMTYQQAAPPPTNFSQFLLATSASGSNSANLALARQAMLRPIGYAGTDTSGSQKIVVDHPNFTGSNPNANTDITLATAGFDPVNGPYDVDTDGDGIADSVWVDLGMPVQTAPDGTTYKPLFAIRVLDMDGRLNVNAHGNSAQVESAYSTPQSVPSATAKFAGNGTNPLMPATLPTASIANAATYPTAGTGYGTAEINLQPLFTEQGLSTTQYEYLLGGNGAAGATATYEGRNGESGSTAHPSATVLYDSTVVPSTTTPPYPGVTNSGDVEVTASTLGLIKHWEFPFPGYPTMLTAYGSAPDLWGRSVTALDIGGAPLTPSMSGTATTTFQPFQSPFGSWVGGLGGPYDTLSNPYTLNLSRTAVRGAKSTGATDNPFTPAELERLLRSNDADVNSLPPRLAALLGATSPPAATPTLALAAIALLRRQVTTDSWDLPSPNFLTTSAAWPPLFPYSAALPYLFPNGVSFPRPFNSSAADILLTQMVYQGGTPPQDPMLPIRHPEWNNVPIQLQLMLPPELLNGQRFDINRAFGNGRDDDGDGVVDEPDEYGYGEPAWITPTGSSSPMVSGTSPFPNNPTPNNAINLAVDWNGDGKIDINDALMARHLMARHLYVLAMMILDPEFNNDMNPIWNQQNSIQYDADGIAPGYVGDYNIYQIQYALAQWAINCVDFRDRDSVMTPFEFDINPLDGWSVDGVVGNGSLDDNDLPSNGNGRRGLVWGCERPELLITETLAWHDRRTQDLAAGGGTIASGDYGAAVGGTPDFDQALLPMPACFIELYNPWTTQYSNLNTTTGEKQNAPAAAEVSGEFYYDQHNSNVAYQPYTSYPTAQPPTGVILNKLDTLTSTSPVWRLIFVNGSLTQGGAQLTTSSTPDSRIVDPDDPLLLLPGGNTLSFNNYIDRIVYFVAPPAGGYAAGFPAVGGVPNPYCTVYYPGSGQPQATLKPGRYAVVGSAGGDKDPAGGSTMVSKLGRNTGNTSDSNAAPIPPGPDTAAHRIALTPNASSEINQVVIYSNNQTATEPAPIGTGPSGAQNAIAIALDTAITSGGTAAPRSFGISDPVGGYGIATSGYNGAGEPQIAVQPQPLDATAGDPHMMTNGTLYGYRTVHLQRLANPQIKWDAITNPYLTIDSASVDVTAFNGVSPTQDPAYTQTSPYSVIAGSTQAIQSTAFCSTQRGDQYAGTPPTPPVTQTNQVNLLWAREYGHSAGTGVVKPTAVQLPTSVFPLALNHSLGYLNQMYGIASATANAPYTAAASTAYTPPTYPATSAYLGMPTVPFPWLPWNNRPYTTPLELALVPKSRSSRLLSDISNGPTTTTAGTGLSIYNSQSGGAVLYPNLPGAGPPGVIDPVANNGGTATTPFFGHLLNFFDSGQPNPVNNSATGNHPPANLYRLFEYLQVPSRFVGTETVLSPVGANYGNMNSTGTTLTAPVQPTLLYGDAVPGTRPSWIPTSAYPLNPVYTLASSPMGTYLRPPLNKVSEYRDPGRVNINTVQDAAVWQGVLNGSFYPQLAPLSGVATMPNIAATVATQIPTQIPPSPSYTPAFGVGSGVAGTPVPNTTPSYFTNPFRSYSGAALTNSIYGPSGLGSQPYPNAISIFANPLRDIDVTLLRPAQFGTAAVGANTIPALFDAQPIASNTAALSFNDPVRSPFFRLQNASRMSNLLTTRSNVYAVWITVGNFQVTPWYGVNVNAGVVTYGTSATGPVVYDTAHQDGYQLGQELGSDTGQIKRHRAFYIFDRTIPVGFERGVDHNVQNAILLRRYIE
jgi:hypothetical protein